MENKKCKTSKQLDCSSGVCEFKKTPTKSLNDDFVEIIGSECKQSEKSKDGKMKWDKRFMDMCKLVSSWSTCARVGRKVGSIIVKDKRIIATGYNGAPMGIMSCVEKGYCMRDRLNIESGTRQEICFATHAEQNALIQAAKLGVAVDGATIYITHQPCAICTKLIINAGIKRIVYGYNYPDDFSISLLKNAGIELVNLPYTE